MFLVIVQVLRSNFRTSMARGEEKIERRRENINTMKNIENTAKGNERKAVEVPRETKMMNKTKEIRKKVWKKIQKMERKIWK